MRSFSFVLAWFFACLVCIMGEVQEGYSIKMCRYRIFGKDTRMKVQTVDAVRTGSNLKTDGIENKPDTSDKLKPRDRARGNDKPSSSRQGKKVKPSISTIGLNVAYPMGINQQVPHFLKYPTSHYEINLGASHRHFHPTASLASIYEAETDQNDLHTTVHIGGEKFHQLLIEACYKAQADFLAAVPAQITAEELASAALVVMYNSRQLYSLLCTAHRCQQCVNAQDEDGVYLAVMLNQHVSSWINYNAVYQDTLTRPLATLAQANDINFRHGLCFSGIYSNAAWVNLWAQAYRCMRMPKEWFVWCENMFSNFHVVMEDGSSNEPRFVSFWPDGEIVTLGGTAQPNLVAQRQFDVYHTVDTAQGHGGMVTLDNAHLGLLENVVVNIAQTFAIAMTAFPQLELVFKYLNCVNSNDYTYTRDIESRTIRVSNRLNDIKDLIYSSAVASYITMTNTGVCGTYSTSRLDDLQADRPLYIRRSPNTKIIPRLSKDDFRKLTGAAVQYVDRAELTEADYALLNGHLAPISYNWWGRRLMDGTHTTQAFRTPLVNFSTFYSYIYSMNLHYAGNPGLLYQELSLSYTKLTQEMGAVLPREHCQLAGMPSATAEIIYLYGEGCIDNYYDYVYGLKDYLVPILYSGEFIDRYCDYLALS